MWKRNVKLLCHDLYDNKLSTVHSILLQKKNKNWKQYFVKTRKFCHTSGLHTHLGSLGMNARTEHPLLECSKIITANKTSQKGNASTEQSIKIILGRLRIVHHWLLTEHVLLANGLHSHGSLLHTHHSSVSHHPRSSHHALLLHPKIAADHHALLHSHIHCL